jgi:Cu(I)/Ag(I) efflux system protein CusF
MSMKSVTCAVLALALAAPAAAQDSAHPAPAAPTSPAASGTVEGVGVVRAVNPRSRSITIDHEAIPSVGWPAMTMGFKVADPALLLGIQPGAKVRFQLTDHTVTGLSPR